MPAPKRALLAFAALVMAHLPAVARAHEGRKATRFVDSFDVRTFLRGNVHTHTTKSDGSASPADVALWYKSHGYRFLSITDHNVRIDPDSLRGIESDGFVLIPGDGITSVGGGVPVHVNGLCIGSSIRGDRFQTRDQALTAAVSAVRAQGGVPLVNHPNFRWALAAKNLAAVGGTFLMEVWSGHPTVHTDGNAAHPSHESQWDDLLSRGRAVFGVAVDDMHHLRLPKNRQTASLPGRGWIETFGDAANRASICRALEGGRFYASSGPTLKRIAVDGPTFTVWVDDRAARVDFIGEGGAVLASKNAAEVPATAQGYPVSYTLHGEEAYVRAKVTLRGASAWTQAYRTR